MTSLTHPRDWAASSVAGCSRVATLARMAGAGDELLTVAEVAELLKLNQQTVRNWIDAGQLPAVRVGPRRVRVTRAALEGILEPTSTTAPRPKPFERDFLTVVEVAELLRLNQQTVRNWIDGGRLQAVRVGERRVRVPRSALDELIGRSATVPVAKPSRLDD